MVIPLFPDVATDKTVRTAEQTAAVNEWRIAANAALSEVRRLASDGVPVMTRNVLPYLLADSEELERDGYLNASVPRCGHLQHVLGTQNGRRRQRILREEL